MLSDQDLRIADGLGNELIRLVRLVERKRDRYHAEHPQAVERATYHLLVQLVRGGPQRAGALAESVHSDPSTISRQVAQLVRLGYVQRTADPADRRATRLAATAQGERVFEENRQARNQDLAGVLANWPEQDRLALCELLARFTTALEQAHELRAMPATVPAVVDRPGR